MFYDLGLAEGAGGLNQRNRAAMALSLGIDCVATVTSATDRLTDTQRYFAADHI